MGPLASRVDLHDLRTCRTRDGEMTPEAAADVEEPAEGFDPRPAAEISAQMLGPLGGELWNRRKHVEPLTRERSRISARGSVPGPPTAKNSGCRTKKSGWRDRIRASRAG